MTYSKDVWELNRDQLETILPTPANKYLNTKTEAFGLTFQSGHEASEIGKLILLEKQGQIFGLRLQVRFPVPGLTVYVADAVFAELRDGKLVVVVADAKGFRTPTYRLKRKLFKERYGQEIEEL